MNKILILFAHPALQNSRVHLALSKAVSTLEGVTFNDLYEAYPEFDIDGGRERVLMDEHDIIVMQFPLYWYSTPAILKQWQDIALTYGWAFGHEGRRLEGKKFLVAVSTGGPEKAYQHEGFNKLTMNELLLPIRQTANLCGMIYLPPFVLHRSLKVTERTASGFADLYTRLLTGLRDGTLEVGPARDNNYINSFLGETD